MSQKVEHVYENEWGGILHRPGLYAEIRWYDTTANMTGADFETFLSEFAGVVERYRCSGALIDATSFKMNPANMNSAWRDENIIPRYNAAGINKFAFIMPEGMPAIGAPPAAEGPADFPTAYFGNRNDALTWLTG